MRVEIFREIRRLVPEPPCESLGRSAVFSTDGCVGMPEGVEIDSMLLHLALHNGSVGESPVLVRADREAALHTALQGGFFSSQLC